MKAIYLHAAGAIAISFAIAACVPQSDPSVEATPTPPAVATTQQVETTNPAPIPAASQPLTLAAPEYSDFLDAPQTPGNWNYFTDPDETLAYFSNGSSENAAPFIIRCEVGTRNIWFGRNGIAQDTLMRIRTETTQRTLQAAPVSGQNNLVAVRLSANDRLLDAMALSKGRFAVETAGLPTLYLPAWAEVTRVIEDCR
ncbi:MAG: hypothetical protein ABJP48_08725 [Erythrobacter sp.]